MNRQNYRFIDKYMYRQIRMILRWIDIKIDLYKIHGQIDQNNRQMNIQTGRYFDRYMD